MTSVYNEILELNTEFGMEIEETKSMSFMEYMSQFFDLNTLATKKDSDYSEDALQLLHIKVAEIRDEVKRSIEADSSLAYQDKSIQSVFYSSQASFDRDYADPRRHKIIDALTNRYSGYANELQHIDLGISDKSFYNDDRLLGVDADAMYERVGIVYGESLESMIASCMILELTMSIPEDIANLVMMKANDEYYDIFEIESLIEDCYTVEALLFNLDTSVLLYVLGNIADDDDKWPYGNIIDTLSNELGHFRMNVSKLKKAALLGTRYIEHIGVYSLAFVSMLGDMVADTLEESNTQSEDGDEAEFEFAVEKYPYKDIHDMDKSRLMRLNLLALGDVDTFTALRISKDAGKFREWISGKSNFGLLRGIAEELIDKYGDSLYQ